MRLDSGATVHCFLLRCKHTETGDCAHQAMETHYYEKHRALIDALTGRSWLHRPLPLPAPRGEQLMISDGAA